MSERPSRREAEQDAYYDRIADGECVCRLDPGDFYQPPDIEVNPECPVHGEDAEERTYFVECIIEVHAADELDAAEVAFAECEYLAGLDNPVVSIEVKKVQV